MKPLAPPICALAKCIALVVMVIVVGKPECVFGALTGQVSGTVTDGVSHAAIAGVKVVATSPSGTFNTVTNLRGGYAFVGITPDTYTLTFEKSGYALATVT
ncbi:MAG TPA: carboxypeptidase-like regulatory domain-containing protein, partial [Candidatus Eremiobacteraceae bacterium]|nr:carboxypeptidase-like regulatory domain-containing protein [Candidatus Eremiobacteraceae bacterium]